MANTVRIGCISELKFKAKLLELKINEIVEPITNSLPYDFAIDRGNKFIKIQVKTGRLVNGTVRFYPCSIHCNMTKITKKNYTDKIDYFGVYCPDNDGYYLISINKATKREMLLRLNPPKNNNKCNINWAKNYELVENLHLLENIKV
jgi:hypothetical protein